MVLEPHSGEWALEMTRLGDAAAIEELFSMNKAIDPDFLMGWQQWTLLHNAAAYGQCDVMRVILAHGASVDRVDDNSRTPLHVAARNGRFAAAVLLLDHGAKIEARTQFRFTALMLSASSCGIHETTRLLLHRGANLDARNNDENTAEDLARKLLRSEDIALLADVRRASGWCRYVRYPRFCLLMLRYLVARGRAETNDNLLGRLFPAPPKKQDGKRRTRASKRGASLAKTALPREVFWLIVSYWRSSRDYDPARAAERQAEIDRVASLFKDEEEEQFEERASGSESGRRSDDSESESGAPSSGL